jgi:hypothetical protein
MVPPNQKLTPILRGRTVKSAAQTDNLLVVTFTDGSTMKVKLGGPAPTAALQGHTVKMVRQGGVSMEITFSDNSKAQIKLAEETSSVMLRNTNGKLEYAD